MHRSRLALSPSPRVRREHASHRPDRVIAVVPAQLATVPALHIDTQSTVIVLLSWVIMIFLLAEERP